ncbi:MAG: DMT family transporter [Pseudomonadota bacterium]
MLLVAWIGFTIEIILARQLSADLGIAQIAFIRILIQAVILLPWMVRDRGAVWRTQKLGLHAFRSACSASGMVLFYVAFVLLPMAVATTLTFTQALFLTLLAALVLGERLGPRRIGATLVGFLGVIVVTRPGAQVIEPGMLAALGCALVTALLMLCTRLLGRTESRLTIMCYISLFSIIYLGGPAWWTWQPIGWEHVGWLLLLGVSATAAQFLMVGAFVMGEASALAPIDYVRLVYAAIAGYIVFGEVPDAWTWAGSAIIIASALYIAYREQVVAAARTA